MRAVSQIEMTSPNNEVYPCTVASNAEMPSPSPAPANSSTAMLSCCSIREAPIAASAITAAMIRRCFESRSIRKSSVQATFSSLAAATSLRTTSVERRCTAVTTAMQPKIIPAPTSIKLSNPTSSTVCWTRMEAVSPPSDDPAAMNPKKRFAWRGS